MPGSIPKTRIARSIHGSLRFALGFVKTKIVAYLGRLLCVSLRSSAALRLRIIHEHIYRGGVEYADITQSKLQSGHYKTRTDTNYQPQNDILRLPPLKNL